MPRLPSPADAVRRALITRVRQTFNDASKGERPVPPSLNALHPPGSVIWKVHGDVTTMMAGGIAALLLQMLHPAALGGVWDHSSARSDMIGRLRRTARFIAVTTFGDRESAERAIARVRAIHGSVRGTTPQGADYRADDPALLAWVHVAGAIMFLEGWRRFGDPAMSVEQQDRYFAEAAVVARMLGADPVPVTRRDADALVRQFRPQLQVDARGRDFRDLVINAPARSLAEMPVQKLVTRAAVGLLPPFARAMHGLGSGPAPTDAAVRAATFGLAGTLRWAFATDSYRPRPS